MGSRPITTITPVVQHKRCLSARQSLENRGGKQRSSKALDAPPSPTRPPFPQKEACRWGSSFGLPEVGGPFTPMRYHHIQGGKGIVTTLEVGVEKGADPHVFPENSATNSDTTVGISPYRTLEVSVFKNWVSDFVRKVAWKPPPGQFLP